MGRFAVPLADGPPLLGAPSFVAEASVGLGDRLVVRDPAGGLALRDRDGAVEPLVEPGCDPVGLHVARDARSLAVLCRSTGEVRVLESRFDGRGISFDVDRPPEPWDEWQRGRWVDVGGGRVLDLERGHPLAIAEADEVLAEHGGRHLVRGPGRCDLSLVDDAGSRRLEHETCGLLVDRAGPLLLFGGGVVDLVTGRQGLVSGHPWAVHDSGAVLVTTGDRPLWWERIHVFERPCPCASE